MNISFAAIYSFVSVFLAVINLNFAWAAFRKPGKIGRHLGISAVMAMTANLSYLGSILLRTHFGASLFSSLYFVSIDWMLVSLVHFTMLFTETAEHRITPFIRRLILMWGLIDSVILFINVRYEIAISYVDRGTAIARYAYDMKPLYSAHLLFSYILVAMVMFILVRKIVTTPAQYRNQYIFIVCAILLIVGCNAVFLFRNSNEIFSLIDFSILGYSVGLYLVYWSAFNYREKNMLESLTMTIFSNLDQGIVLFDYEGKHIMHNPVSEYLLRNVKFRNRMKMKDFTAACDLPVEPQEDEYVIQKSSLRCGFQRMRDDNETVIGNLFVFSDVTSSFDPLTGFMLWEKFRQYITENPGKFAFPVTVVIFDIIGLDHLNRNFGREVGDQRITNLVKLMQTYLPKNTYYVRGYEAHMVGICPKKAEEDLLEPVEQILKTSDGTVKYGMVTIQDHSVGADRDLIRATERASRSMQVKKLMDPACASSHSISSLVRALRESDSDTEGHVRRTQTMGERLGRRIGLQDAELSDLKLLCLLHDIGKVGIPLEILNKPGKLTDAEIQVLHSHAEKGYQIAMSSVELKPIAQLILSHHERWDGKGYPQKLKGESIPLLSRVISVVDSYDAMVNNRSYRKAKLPEEAQEEMRKNAGTQFDPVLTEEFLQMLSENPEFAEGELTGGDDPRVIEETEEVIQQAEDGNTVAIPYCRYVLDVDDYIIEVDTHFEQITGYTGYDILNERIRQIDLIPPDERTEYIMKVQDQFAKGNIAYLEHNIRRKDGEKRRICCMGKHYFDSAMKAYRSEIVIFLVTENVSMNQSFK